jgi:hypothetical protein
MNGEFQKISQARNQRDRGSQQNKCIARVFRRDSPPTRSRRSAGSGGESSSMLTSVEGNVVQAFSMLSYLKLRCLLALKANE